VSAVSLCESKEELGDFSLAVRHNFSLVVRHTQKYLGFTLES
jgi:hypothetical protein